MFSKEKNHGASSLVRPDKVLRIRSIVQPMGRNGSSCGGVGKKLPRWRLLEELEDQIDLTDARAALAETKKKGAKPLEAILKDLSF